jgi:hypothetical protein
LYRVSHNQKHLADEFMANPYGRASPELQRVLMVFRGEPLEGKPVLICTKPFEEWALAIYSGRRGVPPQLSEHRFTSLEEAERFVSGCAGRSTPATNWRDGRLSLTYAAARTGRGPLGGAHRHLPPCKRGPADRHAGDTANPRIRSDIVFFETGNGGAVFAFSSIA